MDTRRRLGERGPQVEGRLGANTVMHWRVCEPRKNWPEWTTNRAAATYSACDCGWRVPADSKNPAKAREMHLRRAKQHQAVSNG